MKWGSTFCSQTRDRDLFKKLLHKKLFLTWVSEEVHLEVRGVAESLAALVAGVNQRVLKQNGIHQYRVTIGTYTLSKVHQQNIFVRPCTETLMEEIESLNNVSNVLWTFNW